MHILKTTSGLVLMAFGAVLTVGPTTALGQCQTARVTPHDEKSYGNGFSAQSVAIDGDYAVISAIEDRAFALFGGAVYVFRREGLNWVEDAKLIASDIGESAFFSQAVAISGDRILVGAPGDDELGEDVGAAYLFRRDGQFWVEEAKLLPSAQDVEERLEFGDNVALSGDRALVGTSKRSVFVFRREGTAWVEEAILRNDEPILWVGYTGDHAVMTADTDSDKGGLRVFRRKGTSWFSYSLLTTSEPEMGSQFWSGAMSGDLIVAGEINGYSGAGFVVVFRKEGTDWIEEVTLRASDAEPGDRFGAAVAIDGDMVFVGAKASPIGDRPGAVYVFQHDGTDWIETGKLTASDTKAGDEFGISVAASGGTVLVGRSEGPLSLSSWDYGKAAYFFEVGGDCNDNGSPDGCDILNGFSEDCDGNVVPDECETSPDCNDNGIRDDCEITEGIIADCNHNAVPDDCDVIWGTSLDDDDDGVPDECGEPPAFGRCELLAITPEGPLAERFGWDVAIDGDRMVIGSYGDDGDDFLDPNRGAIYIYQHDGAQWVLETRIPRPDDEEAGDNFGETVAIDGEWIAAATCCEVWVFRREGDTWVDYGKLPVAERWGNGFGFGRDGIAIDGDRMIVGSPFDDSAFNFAGAAHLYRLEDSAWVEEVKLTPELDTSGELFGWDVALNGDLAVIGAPWDDDLVFSSGSVYLYRATGPEGTWTLDTKLHAPDGGSGDEFGRSVATDGDLIAVGAPFDTNVILWDGTVYIYRREGSEWILEARLTAPDPEFKDLFGFVLSLSGDRLLVGANSEFLTLTGKAYVFRRVGTTWTEEARFTVSDGSIEDHGFTGAGISGNRLVLGAAQRGTAGSNIGMTTAYGLEGDNWVQTQELTPGAVKNAHFGASVAISEDLAVVGAVDEDNGKGKPSGVAYVYQRENASWRLIKRLAVLQKKFAYSVAVEGDDIIVGYPGNHDYAGEVRAYLLANGEVDGSGIVLRASDPDDFDDYDRFGHSVSISGDRVLIGANKDDDWGRDSGSAHVFVRDGDGWVETAKLSASDAQADDHLGESVSISGFMAAVGATQDRPGGSGAVYLFFNPNTPRFETLKLTASDSAEGDRFGASVALDNGLLVVGATQELNDGTGAVYVFRKLDPVTWVEEAKLVASDAAPGDRFGCSVAVREDLIVVGASGNDDAGTDSGASYVFRHDETGWSEVMKTVPSGARPGDQFGVSVAIDGDYAMVGASFVDYEAIDSGSAYLFAVDGPDLNIDGLPDVCDPDCNDNGVDDEFDIADGISEDCTGNGMPDECEPDCNDNGAADSCDLSAFGVSLDCNLDSVPDECQLADNDCNANAIPDDCDVDINADGVPDDCCTDNAFCHDDNPCNFDMCVSNVCQYTPAAYGDVAANGSACGPDGQVNLSDILAILDGFQGVFAAGCGVSNIDIASQSDACAPDGVIDLSDILAVLDAFQGDDACCPGE